MSEQVYICEKMFACEKQKQNQIIIINITIMIDYIIV